MNRQHNDQKEKDKGKTMVDKVLHRKQKIKHYEHSVGNHFLKLLANLASNY